VIEIDTVLIKVASRCNINCTYCYVYNMGDSGWAQMPNHISLETTHAVAKTLNELTRIGPSPFRPKRLRAFGVFFWPSDQWDLDHGRDTGCMLQKQDYCVGQYRWS
jgi:hypothetical protein